MDRSRERTLRNISSVAELHEVFRLIIEADVAWGEMDAYKHVNNVVYFRYFENARVAYLTRSGWDALEEKTGVGIVVRRIEASYHAPLQYPCHVWLAARVPISEASRGDRFAMEYAVSYIDEGGKFHVAVTGESENVLINNKATPPAKVEMTGEIRELIAKFEARPRPTQGARMPIIGVVGMTDGVTKEIANAARDAGREIVSGGAILLTGGQPSGQDASRGARAVKDGAMDGAVEAGAAGCRARMIGILPKQVKPDTTTPQPNPTTRYLLVHTTLTSYQRNCLTGRVPDVVIALRGNAGTLSEIGLALEAGRPVVFLDSFDYLRSKFGEEKERRKLDEILSQVKSVFPAIDTDEVLRRLAYLLQGENASDKTASPEEAVKMALKRMSKVAGFLEVEGCTVSADVFAKQLLALCQ
jgi:acyl-CoA thioester hydrolase